jgi:transcriptional regulator
MTPKGDKSGSDQARGRAGCGNENPLYEPNGTTRQRIIHLLSEEESTARDISKRLGIREKEVYEHLAHISRTMTARGKRLKIAPFACLSCGHVFRERGRFTRPSRCPLCKYSRIEMPVYKLT